MEGYYEVLFGDQGIGNVQVTKEGLYYRFNCRCTLSGDVVCKLTACWEDRQESLGVLVPSGEGFGLNTKVAAKKCGRGRPQFRVVPSKCELREKFIPISPEEPFTYIQRLKDAFFERRYGQAGIVIRETEIR